MSISRIALLGFGEVGQILGYDLTDLNAGAVSAWDIKFTDSDSAPARALIGNTVGAGEDAADAVKNADLVISAVTAEQTLAAASDVAGFLADGAFFLDMNSASPSVKQEAAKAVNAGGGRYVEAAVMSPFPPKRMATPMLLGGPHANKFVEATAGLGFANMSVFSAQYGTAAAAKMCRSVMVKGVEALLMEALLTARRYGVEESVLTSLDDLFPGPNWEELSRYMISRSLIHGGRRAEEMREAIRTVRDAGLDAPMSAAIAERQGWAAQFGAASNEATLAPMLDGILNATQNREGSVRC